MSNDKQTTTPKAARQAKAYLPDLMQYVTQSSPEVAAIHAHRLQGQAVAIEYRPQLDQLVLVFDMSAELAAPSPAARTEIPGQLVLDGPSEDVPDPQPSNLSDASRLPGRGGISDSPQA